MTESSSLVAPGWGQEAQREEGSRDNGDTKKLLGVMESFVILIVRMSVPICQNLSNGTLYVSYTSIKLLEKEKEGPCHETKTERMIEKKKKMDMKKNELKILGMKKIHCIKSTR